MTDSSRDSVIRRLILWNRVWQAAAIVVVVILGGQFAMRYANGIVYEVSTGWYSGTLSCSTISGPLYITHLLGYDGTTPIAARLPQPVFVLDSGAVKWSASDLAKLSWRDEGGGEHRPPAIGTAIRALYIRLQRSVWKEVKAGQ